MENQNKILIIEDHVIIVWALTNILDPDFPDTILYSVSDFEHGLRMLEENFIDLVVIDIDPNS